MIQRVSSIQLLREAIASWRTRGETVGFVPTMGYLHEGHLSLVRRARQLASRVVVSIFVNPTQFNNPSDFEKYPIDIDRDQKLLETVNADALFLPTPESIYGTRAISVSGVDAEQHAGAFQSWVTVEQLTARWEGAHRPGHFRGVTTVVSILFNIVQADIAVFGEKDFQQLRVIEQMAEDLKFGVRIVRGPLVREPDGLAMSSRNVRLSPEARRTALSISRGLLRAESQCKAGEKNADTLCAMVQNELRAGGISEIEYVACAAERSLAPLSSVREPARLLVAVNVGGVRLIDNVALVP